MYVLTPLSSIELEAIFNDNAKLIIQYFIKKSIFSQPEKLPGQNDLPIQIPKEHIEQRLAQALGVISIGAGSYPIDLLSLDNKRGADVKMLSANIDQDGNLTNDDSGETSLAQKFRGTGASLDSLFLQGEHQVIMDEWFIIFKEKLEKVINEHNLEMIYYFIILRGGENLYLLGMQVDINNLPYAKVNKKRSTSESVFIDNFIDRNLGFVKIYKAKKRLELRLKPKGWEDKNYTIKFPLNIIKEEINFKDFVERGGNIFAYGKKEAENIFK